MSLLHSSQANQRASARLDSSAADCSDTPASFKAFTALFALSFPDRTALAKSSSKASVSAGREAADGRVTCWNEIKGKYKIYGIILVLVNIFSHDINLPLCHHSKLNIFLMRRIQILLNPLEQVAGD